MNHITPIKHIYNKLKNSNIEWYITGKTNLALQGIDIKPRRIGILIYERNLEEFLKLFKDERKSEIIELENGEAKEFVMYIDDIEVIVCAEYERGIYWQVFKEPVKLEVEDMILPCFNLESDKEAYERLGMLEKAKIIEEFLREKK